MKSALKYREKPVNAPARVVDLMLTYDCNAMCPYCFVKDRGAAVSMSPAVLDRGIDWIAETGGKHVQVVFLGGEPTLEPLLIERAVMRCRRWESLTGLRFSFAMTTNFIDMNPGLAGKLARWNVRYMVSIDGVGSRHDRSRPVKGLKSPFKVIENNLKKCKPYQPEVTARVTVIPRNVDRLREDLQYIHRMGIGAFIVAPATGVHWTEEKTNTFVSQMTDFVSGRETVNGTPSPKISFIDDQRRSEPADVFHWGCGAGKGRYCIDPLGNIFGCARFAEMDAQKGLVLGDVYRGLTPGGNIREFYHGPYVNREDCAGCDMKGECLGGCPAVNLDVNGSIASHSGDQCRFVSAFDRIRKNVSQNKTAAPHDGHRRPETMKLRM